MGSLTNGAEASKTDPPVIGVLLAYAAMLPVALGTIASLLLVAGQSEAAVTATIIWSGAVLCFLAGVRRGLSFRQPGGPTMAQLAVMMGEFIAGAAALLSPWRIPSLCLLLLGYASLALLDPLAARRHEAPLWFARLRPPQMLIPIVALTVLLVRIVA